MSYDVSNPQEIRTKNRRKTMSKTWKTKQWKEDSKLYCEGKSCEWCGHKNGDVWINEKTGKEYITHLIPHHPYQDTKDGVYSDLELCGCIVVCTKCHFMYHRRHKKLCPVCHIGWRHLDTDMCHECWKRANPDIVKQREIVRETNEQKDREFKKDQATKRRVIKRDFPCIFRGIEQKCRCKPGTICGYSKTKAKNCLSFTPKKKIVKK